MRGRPQAGHLVSESNVVRQSRQRAGITQFYQGRGTAHRQMNDLDDIPFHGAKVAILVGGSILLIRRDEIPTIPWPGYWDMPGGAREPGETASVCVIRETEEELGVSIPNNALKWRGCWESAPNHIWFFVVEWPDFDIRTLRFGGEGQRFAIAPIEWFLTSARAIPSQKVRLRAYMSYRARFGALVLPA